MNTDQPEVVNTDRMPAQRFTMSFGRRLTLFVCLTVFLFVVASFIAAFIAYVRPYSLSTMRIMSVMQDVLVFILPPLIVAVLACRRADWLLCLRSPQLRVIMLALCTLVISIPLMNFVVELNESMRLPEWLSGLEQQLQGSEKTARDSINALMAPGTGGLIMAILIVGVLAGFSEELFFRAGLQRLLSTGPCGRHASIWICAIIFSAVHLQFYGFVPRMLLGAYFGYLLMWSRSLWVPVIVHATNNIIYIIGYYAVSGASNAGETASSGATSGVEWVLIAISLVGTIAGLYLIRKSVSGLPHKVE